MVLLFLLYLDTQSFFNSIHVSFPVAFLAVQVRAILLPGQSEKLKAVRQQAIAGASEEPRLIIRERFNNSQEKVTAQLASASCFVDKQRASLAASALNRLIALRMLVLPARRPGLRSGRQDT